LWGYERPWDGGWCPGYGVAADGVTREDVGEPLVVVFDGEDRKLAVGRCAGEDGAELVRGPRDGVDGRGVEGVLAYLGPVVGVGGGRRGLLFFPDEDLAVVRARREDVPELGVCPRNLPDGPGVASQ